MRKTDLKLKRYCVDKIPLKICNFFEGTSSIIVRHKIMGVNLGDECMDKKKLVGLLIFTVILTAYLSYPSIHGWHLERRVNTMIEKQQYQRIYNLLSDRELDPSSNQYLNLLKAKIALGDNKARLMLNNLVKNQELEALQKLVDELGITLGNYLIDIYKMEGIVYQDEVREHLSFLYAFLGENLDRAMELRGDTDGIDYVYLAYLAHKGDLEALLNIYEDIPEHLLPHYYNIIVRDLIHAGLMYNPEDAKILLDNLMEYDFPERVLFTIGIEFVDIADSLWVGLNEHPFFAENIYYEFFYTYSKLSNPDKRDETLLAIRSDRFKHIKGRDILMELAENATLVHDIFSVTSEGKLNYSIISDRNTFKNYFYHLDSGGKKEVDFNLFHYRVSPNRSYIAATEHTNLGRHILIVDKNMDIKLRKEANNYLPEFWVNNSEIVLRDELRDSRQVLNVETFEIRDYAGENPYLYGFEPEGQGFRLWSIDEERYIGLEIENNQFHYVIRNRKNHQKITSIPLEYLFLGSCDEYIYGIQREEGFINILVRQRIDNKNIEKLPFYSIKDQVPHPTFIRFISAH